MDAINENSNVGSSFDELIKVLDANKSQYEIRTTNNESASCQYRYILYRFPIAREHDEIRIYEDEPNIDTIVKCAFQKYRGIMNYEAIYSEELKCIECEVQAGYSYTGASVIEKLSRCLKKDDEEKERRSPFRLILFEDENIKVSLGPMSTELAFLSLFKRGRRHMYDLSRYTNRPSVRIENIECKKEVEARKILEKVTNSIFYQIDFLYSSTITLVSRRESGDERLRKEKGRLERNITVTELKLDYEYDEIPMSLYWFAQNNNSSPYFRYLALYQVLEYYLPIYARENMKDRIRRLVKDPSFNINLDTDVLRLAEIVRIHNADSLGDERAQLALTIRKIVESEEVIAFIRAREYLSEYYSGKQWEDVSDKKLRISDKDGIISDLSARIYDIRCRIVHNKASEIDKKILPLTKAEGYLINDVELLLFIARKAIIANSKPINYKGH